MSDSHGEEMYHRNTGELEELLTRWAGPSDSKLRARNTPQTKRRSLQRKPPAPQLPPLQPQRYLLLRPGQLRSHRPHRSHQQLLPCLHQEQRSCFLLCERLSPPSAPGSGSPVLSILHRCGTPNKTEDLKLPRY